MSDRTDHTPAPTGTSEDVTRPSLTRSTDSPCPRWCLGPNPSASKDTSHEWEDDPTTGLSVRYHDAYRGAHVSVDIQERRGQDGASAFEAPRTYGPDMNGQFSGERHSPELLRAFSDELRTAAAVLKQVTALEAGCPASWCNGNCDRDVVGDSVTHWSDTRPLPASDGFVPDDLPQPTISAVAHQEAADQPLGDVSFMISSKDEHYRSAGRARKFAQAILAFVDEVAPSGAHTP